MSRSLNRVTVNLTQRTDAALKDLVATGDFTVTTAVNASIQRMNLLRGLQDADGCLTVIDPNGNPVRIYTV